MSSRRIAYAFTLALLLPLALPLIPTAAAASFGAGTTPTFIHYPGPTGLAASSGEPSVGINWETGALFVNVENYVPLNIPPRMKTAKIMFDDTANPPTAGWTDVSGTSTHTRGNVDPMLFTDSTTGRTWSGGLDGACSLMAFTDDDGLSWTPMANPCAATLDHQTVASGPYAGGIPPHATYDRIVYYCAQASGVSCATSVDGGLTFGATTPVTCGFVNPGLHGSVHVGPNGYAWLPFKNGQGQICVARSTDNGLTWTGIKIPGTVSPSDGFDPDVATTPDGTVYVGFQTGGSGSTPGTARVAMSHDDGATWTVSSDLGLPYGLKVSTFHEMVAGDNGRAALAFLGTTTCCVASAFNGPFSGIWHLYVATTYDGGASWTTVRTSDDPVQRGCIWDNGGSNACRNMLDFMDAQVDKEGRVVVVFADGCINACALPGGSSSQSTSSWATLARQTTGKGLFEAYDAGGISIDAPVVGIERQPANLAAVVTLATPYSLNINWGDGNIEAFVGQTSTAFAATHTYATDGQYAISISGQGSDGGTAVATTQASISDDGGNGGAIQILSPEANDQVNDLLTVTGIVSTDGNTAPIASFTHSVSGATATFDASASSDPDGDAIAYSWTFGDGATGVGIAPAHTYAAPGTFAACLTVGDGSLSSQLCLDVTIQAAGPTLLGTDAEGDATSPIPGAGNVDDMDIIKLEATTSENGEPVLIVTLKTLDVPDHHATHGGDGAQWQVEWTGPQGVDFVSLNAAVTTWSCQWGFINEQTTFYEGQGAAPCTVTPGTPGKITMTYPAAAMTSRGYVGGDTLVAPKVTTGIYQGTPQDVSIWAGGTTPVDDMNGGDFVTAPSGTSIAPIGFVPRQAAAPAPSSPPANPHITDNVADPIGDNAPTTNVESAWFDSDASYLYVGMKVQDIPADTSSTAFIAYTVNFNPSYEILDPTWGGRATTTTPTGLRAFALYSPLRGNTSAVPGTPEGAVTSDTATVLELQLLTTDGTRSFFSSLGRVGGSVNAGTDIIWWTIPRALLQNPPASSTLETTSAGAIPAVGGVVTLGTAFGDSTGPGEVYQFPGTEVTPPTVTLSAAPTSGIAPLSVGFAGTSTPNNVATWTLSFGDGTPDATGSGALPATIPHIYDIVGSHTATLTVTATDGGVGTGQAVVSVTNGGGGATVLVSAGGLDPVAATCTNACANWNADLDLSSLDGGDVTVTAMLVIDGETRSTDSVILQLVRSLGVVIDTPGADSEVDAGDIAVTGRLTGSSNRAPLADLSADRSEGLAPLAVEFSLAGTDDQGIVSFRFETGDGRIVDGTALPTTVSHTYTTAGSYTARLTVRDAQGATGVTSGVIRVQAENTPPTAPSNPTPANGATDVATPALLSWTATDADGNTLSYDIYLDTAGATTLVASDQTSSYIPTGLLGGTTYNWRVVAKDGIASTSGPVWSFTTATAPLTEASKPQVVVAVIDSGVNVYHNQFRRANLVDHPSTYLTGFPANAVELDLCFYDKATKTVSQSGCPASATGAATADLNEWKKHSVSGTTQVGAGQGKIAWVPGTNVLMVSFAHEGDANYPSLDGAKGAGDSHGTWVASNVAGITTGTCPECIVVVIEGDTVDGIEAAYKWAANQPWIDIVTSSVSIGIIGIGWNPGDFFDATSGATKTAVTNGKLVFESSGNGIGNAGLAPTSTFLGGNGNPWTIPVGCSAEHTGQSCGYHDFPNAITASGVSRIGSSVDSFSATAGVGGTSFSSPSSAGVAARTLYAVRTAMNDTQEGPSATGAKSLVRVGPGATAPASGPLANGALTRLELEEAIFKTARRPILPQVPWYVVPSSEIVDTPVNFIKAGYGNVYRGDWGVNGPGAEATWSSAGDAAAVVLGNKALPNRWLEEQWWEGVVEPMQELVFDVDVPDTDTDAFPMDGTMDEDGIDGYTGTALTVQRPDTTLRAAVPTGVVPTAAQNRLYLHHNNLGPDPESPVNSLIEYYLNSIPDPTGGQTPCNDVNCADQNGLGGTGVGTAGGQAAYEVAHPSLGGPLVLDTTKDIVVHVDAVGFAGGPASPTALRVTLMAGETLVGAATPANQPGTESSVYEARFKPLVNTVTDPLTLTLAWDGPVYSYHAQSKGKSWMDLPVLAALPPLTYEPVIYYADDVALATTNGATITITRDATALAGDANKNSVFTAPQVEGVKYQLQANDILAAGDAILADAGTASVYLCTASTDAGAAVITAKASFSVNGVPIGGGSITKQIAGPNDGRTVPVAIPLSMRPHLIAAGQQLQGVIEFSGPAGIFAHNTGICGGGADMPWSFSFGVATLDAAPKATIDTLPATISGMKTISGTAQFPAAPAVAQATWSATNMDTWDNTHQELAMDTTGPGEGSDGPIFPPSADGLVLTFRSARPVAEDAATLSAEGVGTAQFWVTSVASARDVTVDFTVALENAAGAQRLLGEGSLTKHITTPLGTVEPLVHQQYVIGFTPLVTDPQPDEKLVMLVNVHNAGPASTSHITCMCGGADQPVSVTLPRDASTTPTDGAVDLSIGGIARTVAVANGVWTTQVDTRTIANGAHTLSVTPHANYGGTVRTGLAVTQAVEVSNVAINTPPTASLSIAPASGFAPLAVSATLGGTDAQTASAALGWSINWGDGSAVSTGVGLPAIAGHTYAVGNFVATLTVTDAGGMIDTKTASTSAFEAPPVEKVIVLVDGASPVDATDTAGDGSFSSWAANVNIPTAGVHTLTARHMIGDDVQSESIVSFRVVVPNLPTVDITAPLNGDRIDLGAALVGTAGAPSGTIDAVSASIDGFATSVAATTSDGYASWSVDLDALGLAEDIETLVIVRATNAEGSSTDAVTLTLDASPNPTIAVITALPAPTGTSIEFQSGGTSAASGAAIVSWAWQFGDAQTSTQTHATHAYARSGTYTVTLDVMDANGRAGSVTKDVLITNRLPVVTLDTSPTDPTPVDTVTITSSATDADGSVMDITTTAYAGTTRASATLATGGASISLQFPDDGSYLLVARAVDDEGGASETETILVVLNARPIADLVATPTLVGQGNDVTFDASGSSDPDGTLVEYRFDLGDGSPARVTTTPVLTHSYDQSGLYQARVTVVDDDGSAIISDAVTINVNARPVLGAIGNKVVAEGATLSFTLSATDAENDALTYSAEGLPAGATLDPQTGAFAWTTGYEDEGNYQVTFSVTDGYSTDSETIFVSVGNVNLPPVLTPIGPKDGLENTLLTFAVEASDPDTPTLTYAATGLPAGATFSTVTGVFSWTPTFTQAGAYALQFSVNDGDTTLIEDVVITIANNDRSPVLQPLAPKSVYQLATVVIPLVASDPDGDVISFSVSGAPGATIGVDALGNPAMRWTPTLGALGPYTVTVYAMSGELATSQTTIVTVLFKTDASVVHRTTSLTRASPGDVVTLTARVTNTGPQTDTFTLSADNTAGWAIADVPAPVTLAAGAFIDMSVNVTIPVGSAKSFTTLYARSVGDITFVRSARFTVEVPVVVSEVVLAPLSNLYHMPTGHIALEYLSGAAATNVDVRAVQMHTTIGGPTQTTASGKTDADGKFSFDFSTSAGALAPGSHQIVFTASLPGGPVTTHVVNYSVGVPERGIPTP